MNKSRRHLLILGGLTAVSATLPLEAFGRYAGTPAATAAHPTDEEYNALHTLTADDFKAFVGAAFHTQSQAGRPVRVILAEVQSPPTLAAAPATPVRQTYALRFKAWSGPTLKQDTYVFRHPGLPGFAMLVVPSAAGSKPMYYTGQVNRSV